MDNNPTHRRGFWTKEACLNEAIKYKSREDFRRGCPSAYGKAWRKGWLNEICSHMPYITNKNHYWTKERCLKEAQKYHRRIDFRKQGRGAYNAAYTNGWLEDVCIHMDRPPQYTKEECSRIAKQYRVERDWRINQSASYLQAERNGWLGELTAHMKKMHRYSKEQCQAEALKYCTKKDFMNNSPQHYFRACDQNWIQDICTHMTRLGNSQKRQIYVFEFSDHYAYVGLSYNPQMREKEHLKNSTSTIHRHIQQTGTAYTFKLLTDFLDKEEASRQEDFWIKKYQVDGWIMLNQKHGGDLGGNRRKYTKKYCLEIARKYNYRSEFIKNDKTAYERARQYGYLDEVCAHMQPKRKIPTKEEMAALVSKYNSLKVFREENINAYNFIRSRGWSKELLSHLEQRIYWTTAKVVEEARKYSTRKDFRTQSPRAYDYARRHKILNECYAHIPSEECQ